MAQIRVKLSYDAKSKSYYVDLPSHQQVKGSFLPITPGFIHQDGVVFGADPAAVMALNPTVLIECQDDYIDKTTGKVNSAAVKAMYGESARFTNNNTPPNV